MSIEKFQEARKGLAFSQSLMDKLRVQNMAQPQPEMAMEGTETPMPVSQEKPQPDNEIQVAVKEAMEPYMKEIKALIEEKDEEPKEVKIKIDGEMKPKEDKDE